MSSELDACCTICTCVGALFVCIGCDQLPCLIRCCGSRRNDYDDDGQFARDEALRFGQASGNPGPGNSHVRGGSRDAGVVDSEQSEKAGTVDRQPPASKDMGRGRSGVLAEAGLGLDES